MKHGGLHDLYIKPNIIPVIKSRRIEIGGACSRYGIRRVAYRTLVLKLEKEGLLGGPRRRKNDYI